MSGQVVKLGAVIALSLALLYSGVAWAMEVCVGHDEHRDHVLTQNHHASQVSSKDTNAHDAVPVIHCVSLNEQIGHAVRVTSTEIRRSENGVAIHAASFSCTLFATRPNALWPEALFRKAHTSSLSSDLARHLFRQFKPLTAKKVDHVDFA